MNAMETDATVNELRQQLAEERAKREAAERQVRSQHEIAVKYEDRYFAALAAAVAIQEVCRNACIAVHNDLHRATNDGAACAAAIDALDLSALEAGRNLLEPLRKDAERLQYLCADTTTTTFTTASLSVSEDETKPAPAAPDNGIIEGMEIAAQICDRWPIRCTGQGDAIRAEIERRKKWNG